MISGRAILGNQKTIIDVMLKKPPETININNKLKTAKIGRLTDSFFSCWLRVITPRINDFAKVYVIPNIGNIINTVPKPISPIFSIVDIRFYFAENITPGMSSAAYGLRD